MKHIWSILCEKSVVDSQRNTISLIDVLEQVNLNMPPEGISGVGEKGVNVLMPFELVSFWVKDEGNEAKDEEALITIEIYDPNSKRLNSVEQTIKIPAEYQRIRSRSHFNGLSVFESGVYQIRVKIRGGQESKPRTVAELPLDIRFSLPINK